MRTRILTDFERAKVIEYVRTNGEKTSVIRTIATRARRIQPDAIRKDLALIERFLAYYK